MGQERRKYYRYPVQGGSEAVVVRHQGVERPAKLVNLSADGFRLDMDEESIVEVGDIVLMATSSGFHRVRVVNVAREGGTLQLGLQRLQDISASAVESQAERRNPRRKRREKPAVSAPLLQVGVPIALSVLIMGTAVWAWTTDADPVGAVVEDRTFATPTSEYGVRRRRQVGVEESGSPGDPSKRRGPRVVGEGEPGSPQWAAGGKSTATADAKSLRSDRSDEPGQAAAQASARKSADPTQGTGAGSETAQSTEFGDARGSSLADSAGSGGSLFDPQANATQSINAALHTAKRENKHVLVEFGANNCDSCNLLHAAFTKDAEIAASFQRAFVLVLVDIDANQNLVSRYVQDEVRVPFLALLDKEGKVLKRRRTEDLEVGSKLDFGKVKRFLQQWSSSG
jgi:Thioredoxin-like